MFIEHIKSNVQSFMTHTPQKPKKLSRRVLLWRGKLLTGKNMVDLGQNRHFFPVIIIPTNVGQIGFNVRCKINISFG